MVQRECTAKIAKIYDQFLNYRCIEQNYFSLDLTNALSNLLDPTIKDEQDIMSVVEQIANGVTSVCMTLCDYSNATSSSASQQLPIVVYQGGRGTPAELVGQTVEKKLRNVSMSNLNTGSGGTRVSSPSATTTATSGNDRRPLLIIVDRSVDYSVCLQHQWMYRPIVHDLFSIHLNRVNVVCDNL